MANGGYIFTLGSLICLYNVNREQCSLPHCFKIIPILLIPVCCNCSFCLSSHSLPGSYFPLEAYLKLCRCALVLLLSFTNKRKPDSVTTSSLQIASHWISLGASQNWFLKKEWRKTAIFFTVLRGFSMDISECQIRSLLPFVSISHKKRDKNKYFLPPCTQ